MKFVHERLAVFRLAGEEEVRDAPGGECAPDEFQHRDKLGEDQDLVSFGEEGLALTLCLFALVLPWLVVPVIAGMVAAVYWIVTIGRRRRQHIADRQRLWRAEREAAEIAAGVRGWLARPTLNLRPHAGRSTKVRRAGRTS